jgi:hypothetical protein
MEVELLHLNIAIKPSLIYESVTENRIIYTLQEETWQHDTRTAMKTPRVATVHDNDQRDDLGLPHPSARLPRDTSSGYLWVAHTLSRYTSWRYDRIASISTTIQATKFMGPHKSCMH